MNERRTKKKKKKHIHPGGKITWNWWKYKQATKSHPFAVRCSVRCVHFDSLSLPFVLSLDERRTLLRIWQTKITLYIIIIKLRHICQKKRFVVCSLMAWHSIVHRITLKATGQINREEDRAAAMKWDEMRLLVWSFWSSPNTTEITNSLPSVAFHCLFHLKLHLNAHFLAHTLILHCIASELWRCLDFATVPSFFHLF